MSYTAEELLSLVEEFEKTASDSLIKIAKAKEKKKFPFWLNKKKNTNSNSSSSGSSSGSGSSDCYDAKDGKGKKKPPFWMKNKDLKDSNSAKDSKVDPKAKVRNRGNVCVPAESAKDKKDHFPINDEAQARNALARVNQFSSVPEWYSGSLQSLVSLVAKKVHAKYPGIKVSKDAKTPGKKKSSYYDNLLNKFAQNSSAYFTAQHEFWVAAKPLLDLARRINPEAEDYLRTSFTDALEKTNDIRDKGLARTLDADTVRTELTKLLANAANTALKIAMDRFEHAVDSGRDFHSTPTPLGGVADRFKSEMKTAMANVFAAAGKLIDATITEVTAGQSSDSGYIPGGGPTMNAPAVREEEASGSPAAPATPKPAGQGGAGLKSHPEVAAIQTWLINQGLGDMLKPFGADGKLGNKTKAALQAKFPGVPLTQAWQQAWIASGLGAMTTPTTPTPTSPSPLQTSR